MCIIVYRDDKDPTAVNKEQTKKKEHNRGSRETQNTAFGSPAVEVKMNHNCRTSATNSNTHVLRTRSDESSLGKAHAASLGLVVFWIGLLPITISRMEPELFRCPLVLGDPLRLRFLIGGGPRARNA